MHLLDRSVVDAPQCLSRYDWHQQNWDDLSPEDKAEIRACLRAMQGTRCAYCEGEVHADGHIEHFRRKSSAHFPELAFVWENLFLACGSMEHCGHYKDRAGSTYSPADLIKPDDDDPDRYLYFHSSGEVRPREGLNAADQRRAMETMRVFNLREPALQARRARALRAYIRRDPSIADALLSMGTRERHEYVAAEIEATRDEPHWSVIRHFFESLH